MSVTTDSTDRPTLVCFGDGSLRDGVSYGANRKPAVCSLRRAFHRRRDRCVVADVDEYMTTRCCSRCAERMAMPPRHGEPTTPPPKSRYRRSHGHDETPTTTGFSFARNVKSLGIATSTRPATSSWWPDGSSTIERYILIIILL